MSKVRFPLFGKIMLWFFLNLILLAVIFLVVFGLNVRIDPGSRMFGNRIETVARLIAGETDERSREERDEILERYSEAYKVEFFLFDEKGHQLAGVPVELPDKVSEEVRRDAGPPRPSRDSANREPRGLPPPPGPGQGFTYRTQDPTTYWMVMRSTMFNAGDAAPVRTRLIIRTDSFYGYGLFFDPWPWLAVGLVVLIVSTLFWLPFVRRLTASIGQITSAAKRIADEDFSVRVDERGSDELGNLGSSINDLAVRLSGFVDGQKRFLGDISHELNSPLARMQFALSILEDTARPQDLAHIADVKEEVVLMSKLVRELLSYSKSSIQGAAVKLEPVALAEAASRAAERESGSSNAKISISIASDIAVRAQPELLNRAIANVLRNSLDYAGENGDIRISANLDGRDAVFSIRDDGPGVPADKLDKIFDPLFRVQDDRSRQTGGTGLGLAIVKTCIEACEGSVSAKNVEPRGLQVDIRLRLAAEA